MRAYDSPSYRRNRKTILAGGPLCHHCRRRRATTADHLLPVSLGGTNNLDNLVPSCTPCNLARGNKQRPMRLEGEV